jgi:hypothetical protein
MSFLRDTAVSSPEAPSTEDTPTDDTLAPDHPAPSAETLELSRQVTIRSSQCRSTPRNESDALDRTPKRSAATAASHRIESTEALPLRWPEPDHFDQPEGRRRRRVRSSTCPDRRKQRQDQTEAASPMGLQGFEQPRDPYPTCAVLPAPAGRSSPGLRPLQGLPLASLDTVSLRHLLSWASPHSSNTEVLVNVLALQSFKERRGGLISCEMRQPS